MSRFPEEWLQRVIRTRFNSRTYHVSEQGISSCASIAADALALNFRRISSGRYMDMVAFTELIKTAVKVWAFFSIQRILE